MPVCRKPSERDEAPPPRIAPLPRLPIFLDLAARRVVLAGGSAAAAWKAELLAACGAHVEIFAAQVSPDMRTLCLARPACGSLRHVARDWRPDDLNGAAVALADAQDQAEAAAFAHAARARGVPVNVIDRPDHCDFQFGSIVNRDPVTIAISTDGAAPILGQAIRRRIEAILPDHLGAWAAAAGKFRTRLAARLPDAAKRRRFWEHFVDRVFSARSGRVPPLQGLIDEAERGPCTGAVTVVETGEGAADLLTLRAVRHLQAADIIVHERDMTDDILDLARREARRITVEDGAEMTRMTASARAGKRIVVLVRSAPRAGEGRARTRAVARAANTLARAADIPVHLVPGVSHAPAHGDRFTGDAYAPTGHATMTAPMEI